MNEELLALSKTLNTRGFQANVCDNSEQAIELIQQLITENCQRGRFLLTTFTIEMQFPVRKING